MWSKNLKLAWRRLFFTRKNRLYTAINVAGLIVGVAAALLIYRIVTFELSFNRDFEDYEKVGRVVMEQNSPEEGAGFSTCTPSPASDQIEDQISQFAHISRTKEMWSGITIPNPAGGPPLKKFNPLDGTTAFFAEPAFLDIFSFKMLAGDRTNALTEPGSIVLTRSWAEKCFDHWESALEKVVLIENIVPAVVEGVLEDPPSNCDFNFPYLISYETLKSNPDRFYMNEGWGSCSSNDQLYAKLIDAQQKESAVMALAKIGQEEYNENDRNRTKRHSFQPLSDLHFSENYHNSGSHRTKRSRLALLSGIGLLILIMACFNFINLTTAQSVLRSKEVGVRKTLGSKKSQLTGQFLVETFLVVCAALFFGALLAYLALPLLSHVSEVPGEVSFLTDKSILIFILIIGLIITLLAGLYPAFILASFRPIEALNKEVKTKHFRGKNIRKTLVIFQFVIAQGLIIAALINVLQLDFLKNQDLGFNNDLVYTFSINNDSLSQSKLTGFKQRLLQKPEIKMVSYSSDQPLSGNTWATNLRYDTRSEDEPWHLTTKFCDEDYQSTYNIRMVVGQWYEPSDTVKDGVVNMKVINKLGLASPGEIVGKEIKMGRRRVRIVGVAENFHTHSSRNEHQPLLLTTRKEFYWEVGVKLETQDLAAATMGIKNTFDEVFPEQVFEGRFLDERIARFYENDRRLSATTKSFGFLAIFISCLGLFGLATHAATQRIKEIGVRKILGASVTSIIGLLSRDFIVMILVALTIGAPIALYLMNNWLNNFIFRIDMPYWVVLATGVVALCIALFTVGIQAFRAATVNPVRSLRDE